MISFSKKKRIAAFVFIFMFSIFCLAAYFEYDRAIENQKQDVQKQLSVIRSNFENIVTSKLISINGLVSYASINPDFSQEEYNTFARGVYDLTSDVVRNLSFITGTVITHVYPFEENQQALGRDLALIPEQAETVLFAKENNRSVFTAPVDLVQGGTGIITRIPIYLNDQYFGQVSIVFDYDKTMEQTGIKDFSDTHYILITTYDPISEADHTIWSNLPEQKHMMQTSLNQTIFLYDSELLIQALPKNGWAGDSQLFYLILIFGFIMSGFASFSSFRLVSSADELQSKYNEIESHQAHINYLADHDPLTDLYSRRKLIEDVDNSLLEQKNGSLILMDIDDFKNINDTLGHVYGDKVIAHVAGTIKEAVKNIASVYRIDGDEFLISVEHQTDPDQICEIIDKINALIENNSVIDEIDNHISTSAGIVRYPEDGDTVEDLLIKLDIALYDAKKSGKSQYKFFNCNMMVNFDDKIRMEKMLRKAIAENSFYLMYQPVLDAKTGEISYFEALIRIHDVFISPAEFIPVAEETGLIAQIGRWVVRESLRQQREWMDKGVDIKPVSINMSPRQFRDEDLVGFVSRSLKEFAVASDKIEIEITENILLDHKDENIQIMKKFKEIGITLALDDFGTGYSSVNYLSFVPVDKIKLDKSLKDKFFKPGKEQVIEGIIAISRGLGLTVVAEGVETVQESNWLKEAGCDYLQGYLFSKPLLPQQAEDIYTKKYTV